MPSPEPLPHPPSSLSRAEFEASLKAHGVALSLDESDSVYKLAAWLSEWSPMRP